MQHLPYLLIVLLPWIPRWKKQNAGLFYFMKCWSNCASLILLWDFWEDTTRGTETHHPNYFHEVHRFQDNLHSNTGATIMQLEAEEDNRDGFSIRLAAEKLLK